MVSYIGFTLYIGPSIERKFLIFGFINLSIFHFFVSHNFFIVSNRYFPPEFEYVIGFFLSSLFTEILGFKK